MDLKTLLDTPPWDRPRDAGRMFWRILLDSEASESDRLVAAELAGDFTVINDDLADALLTVAGNSGEPEQLRARAAISLGPALEQAETAGLEEPAGSFPVYALIAGNPKGIPNASRVGKPCRIIRYCNRAATAPRNLW
jgi:hypothetical protein